MENHVIELENKSRLMVSAVTAVDAFDEETILADLADEGLVISGKNLHIEVLDLEEGKLVATGEIEALTYTKKKAKTKLFDRFRNDSADSERTVSAADYVRLWNWHHDYL